MAKQQTLTAEQQALLASFKEFIAGGVKTKLGHEIDDKNLSYILTKAGKILAKGVVKAVTIPAQPNPLNPTPNTPQDVAMFWDMNANAVGNDGFTLVQIIS